MTMKIKAQLVKKRRTDNLWSQDELARLSGLGLRTIQRVEKEGLASADTIKSLAAVFEIDSSVMLDDGQSLSYKNIQLGGISVLILVVMLLVIPTMFIRGDIPLAIVVVFGIFAVVVALFLSTLTILVDQERVRWHFGIGFWKKSLSLAEINRTRVVRNKWWWGFGIRFYAGGWLYNISGLDAVELQLKDGSRIRLGTDEPSELSSAISDAKLGLWSWQVLDSLEAVKWNVFLPNSIVKVKPRIKKNSLPQSTLASEGVSSEGDNAESMKFINMSLNSTLWQLA